MIRPPRSQPTSVSFSWLEPEAVASCREQQWAVGSQQAEWLHAAETRQAEQPQVTGNWWAERPHVEDMGLGRDQLRHVIPIVAVSPVWHAYGQSALHDRETHLAPHFPEGCFSRLLSLSRSMSGLSTIHRWVWTRGSDTGMRLSAGESMQAEIQRKGGSQGTPTRQLVESSHSVVTKNWRI